MVQAARVKKLVGGFCLFVNPSFVSLIYRTPAMSLKWGEGKIFPPPQTTTGIKRTNGEHSFPSAILVEITGYFQAHGGTRTTESVYSKDEIAR